MISYSFDPSKNHIFEKDGLIFSHLESPYERGLNTLVLHWRDPSISAFCFNDGD